MATCEQIKPLLYHVAECDAAPDEAMRVARHLPDCTACRILLARERRLAAMLERDLEDLPADEEFVKTVMETLPAGPPPMPAGRKKWRGLKLASLAGLLYGGMIALSRGGFGLGGPGPGPSLPSFDPESAQGAGEGLLQLVYIAVAAMRSVATQLPIDLPSSAGLFQGLLLLLLAAGGALVAGSTLLAVAARSLARST